MSYLLTTSLPRLHGKWNLTGQNGFQQPAGNSENILTKSTQAFTTHQRQLRASCRKHK